MVVHIDYLEYVIILIQWDANNYLFDKKKEMEIFQRVQDVIREEKKEKGDEGYEIN